MDSLWWGLGQTERILCLVCLSFWGYLLSLWPQILPSTAGVVRFRKGLWLTLPAYDPIMDCDNGFGPTIHYQLIFCGFRRVIVLYWGVFFFISFLCWTLFLDPMSSFFFFFTSFFGGNTLLWLPEKRYVGGNFFEIVNIWKCLSSSVSPEWLFRSKLEVNSLQDFEVIVFTIVQLLILLIRTQKSL
jgi:hypothetical protein